MVFHVDLNSFFARAEQQSNPSLRGKPIGILGKGHKGARTCVCAASPEAKAWGIKAGMSVFEAQRLCPPLILVPPDYPKYLDISRRFIEILERFTPWVEIFSIDEAFMKIEHRNPKNDLLVIAKQIKQLLFTELGELMTVSIGIAWGRAFAKLASNLQKPDGLVVLEQATWLTKVGTMPTGIISGIGYRIEEQLKGLGIYTMNDLHRVSAGLLTARFGPSRGMHLWQIGQGSDPTPVVPSRTLPPAKSIGHQLTLDTNTPFSMLRSVARKLALRVGRRLRRAGQRAGQIAFFVQFAYGGGWGSHLIRQPAIDTDHDLLASINELYSEPTFSPKTPVRRIGVTAYGLEQYGAVELNLFTDRARNTDLTTSLDAIRNRYGDEMIGWADAPTTELPKLRDWRGPRVVLDQ